MSEAFDPYHRWLGIPPTEQPANHYRLLGLSLFERDVEVIRDAASQRMAHVRTYQLGPNSALSQKILNELGAAKACLLDPEAKGIYDTSLCPQPSAGEKSRSPDDFFADIPQSGPPVVLSPIRRQRRLPQRTLVGAGVGIGLLILLGLVVWGLRSPKTPEVASPQTVGSVEGPSVMARQAIGEAAKLPQAQAAVSTTAASPEATKTPEKTSVLPPPPPTQEKNAVRTLAELTAPAQPPQKQTQPPAAAVNPSMTKTTASQEQKQAVPQKEPAGVSAAPLAPSTNPPKDAKPAEKIIEGVGYGAFRLGASRTDLIRAFGNPENGSRVNWVVWRKSQHLDCLLDDSDKAMELRFNQGFEIPLATGVRVGSDETEIETAYGKPDSVLNKGRAKKVEYTKRGVLFWTSDKRVTQIVIFQPSDKASPGADSDGPFAQKITLTPPYPSSYPGAPPDRLSVQYAVMEVCKEIGVGYNFTKSSQNTDPVCRQWVRPRIVNKTAADAINMILRPMGLTYRLENGEVVLYRR